MKKVNTQEGYNKLPQSIIDKLPPLYANEHLGLEALAQVKFFMPNGNWVWYGSEYDGRDLMFGLVCGHEIELGYFSLGELQAVHTRLGAVVERDVDFKPQTLRQLKVWHERRMRA